MPTKKTDLDAATDALAEAETALRRAFQALKGHEKQGLVIELHEQVCAVCITATRLQLGPAKPNGRN